ncbi:HpcH/HpaI aldolase family protein [Caballeronia sp. DA-9]|uniref:HpcH/HpaI aldolase family protein n=1 Tax=Caballeronia sp. DA-9 TaxID=3436237 RepID=UPI003F66A610
MKDYAQQPSKSTNAAAGRSAPSSLSADLRSGETILSSWVNIPEPLVTEATLRAGFDAVTIDMQHGLLGCESVSRCITSAALVGKPAIVRVPVGDFAMASRALDMGAQAVIAPMINSAHDAKRFVEFTKYPPLGERSFGPFRAMSLVNETDLSFHLQSANRNTLALAMIETVTAVAALEEILEIDGIDGIFLGPGDLSISLYKGSKLAMNDPMILGILQEVATKTIKKGKLATTYASTPERARAVQDMGYRFVAMGNDLNYLSAGAKEFLEGARVLNERAQ